MARMSCRRRAFARQRKRVRAALHRFVSRLVVAAVDAHGEKVSDVERAVHDALHAVAHQRRPRLRLRVVRRRCGARVCRVERRGVRRQRRHRAGTGHVRRLGRAAALLGAGLGRRDVPARASLAALRRLRSLAVGFGALRLARRTRRLHPACAAKRYAVRL